MPLISPSMLSQRLSELEAEGILRKQKLKKGYSYHLTEAGKALEEIIMGMAAWGHQWARDNLMEDLDLYFLAWSMHQRLDRKALPEEQTVVEFDFTDVPNKFCRFWFVNTHKKVDLCLKYPGYETDLLVTADLRVFVETWRGFRKLEEETSARRIKLSGPRNLKEALPKWLLLSYFAPIERRRPGKEKELYAQYAKPTAQNRDPVIV